MVVEQRRSWWEERGVGMGMGMGMVGHGGHDRLLCRG